MALSPSSSYRLLAVPPPGLPVGSAIWMRAVLAHSAWRLVRAEGEEKKKKMQLAQPTAVQIWIHVCFQKVQSKDTEVFEGSLEFEEKNKFTTDLVQMVHIYAHVFIVCILLESAHVMTYDSCLTQRFPKWGAWGLLGWPQSHCKVKLFYLLVFFRLYNSGKKILFIYFISLFRWE